MISIVRYLFMGVSRVLGRMARHTQSFGIPDLSPERLHTSWCTAA